VTMSAPDADSGLGGMIICLNDEGWNLVTEDMGFSLEAPGTYTFQYYAWNIVDNIEAIRTLNATVIEASVPGQVETITVEIVDSEVHQS